MADVGASLDINIEVVPLKQGSDPSHLEHVRQLHINNVPRS